MGLDIVPVQMANPLYVPLLQAGAEKAGENSGLALPPKQYLGAAPKLETVK